MRPNVVAWSRPTETDTCRRSRSRRCRGASDARPRSPDHALLHPAGRTRSSRASRGRRRPRCRTSENSTSRESLPVSRIMLLFCSQQKNPPSTMLATKVSTRPAAFFSSDSHCDYQPRELHTSWTSRRTSWAVPRVLCAGRRLADKPSPLHGSRAEMPRAISFAAGGRAGGGYLNGTASARARRQRILPITTAVSGCSLTPFAVIRRTGFDRSSIKATVFAVRAVTGPTRANAGGQPTRPTLETAPDGRARRAVPPSANCVRGTWCCGAR